MHSHAHRDRMDGCVSHGGPMGILYLVRQARTCGVMDNSPGQPWPVNPRTCPQEHWHHLWVQLHKAWAPRLHLYHDKDSGKHTSLHRYSKHMSCLSTGTWVLRFVHVSVSHRETPRLILICEGTEHAEMAALRVVDSSKILHWSVTSVNYSLQKGHPKHGVVTVASSTVETDRGLILVTVGTPRVVEVVHNRPRWGSPWETNPYFSLILFIRLNATDVSSQMNTSKRETWRSPERKSDFYL